MGSESSKYKYKTVKDTGDLLGNEPVYGNLLFTFRLKQQNFSDPFPQVSSFKLIIAFCNLIRIQEAKPVARGATFNFLFPFGKSHASQLFSSRIKVDLDLSDGVNFLSSEAMELDLKNCFLMTGHSRTRFKNKAFDLPIELEFGFYGKPILDDLKELNLPFAMEEQLESLEYTVKSVESDWAPEFHAEEWKKEKNMFKSGPFVDVLLKTAQKAGCVKKWLDGFLMFKLFEYYEKSQKRISDGEVTEFEMTFPENLDNFVKLLEDEHKFEYYFLRLARVSTREGNKAIYHSRNFYRKMLLLWHKEDKSDKEAMYTSESDIDYIFPRHQDLIDPALDAFKDCLSDEWFFNEFIAPLLETKEEKKFNNFSRLLSFYGNILKNYLTTFKNKISAEQLKQHPHYLFLHNLIETPEFGILPFDVLHIYGHSENNILNGPLVSTFNQYLVSFEKTFLNTLTDQKVITLVAECTSKQEFLLTHVFLKTGKPIQVFTNPARSALFFLTNKVPSVEEVQKFYDFNFDGFSNNQYNDLVENLNPIACIDLDKKQKSEDYDEVELAQPLVGKYLVVILKHNLEESKMIIDAVGGLGFVKKEDFDKHGKLEGGGERVNLPDGPHVEKDKMYF